MFARIVETVPKLELLEKKDEILRVIKNEVLPILRKQHGFLEILPFSPEIKNERFVTITLWADKRDAERYDRETYFKVQEIMKPYLAVPITVRNYMVETTLCEHFEKALAA
jgi:heme-degrading monooxygenase HmoA